MQFTWLFFVWASLTQFFFECMSLKQPHTAIIPFYFMKIYAYLSDCLMGSFKLVVKEIYKSSWILLHSKRDGLKHELHACLCAVVNFNGYWDSSPFIVFSVDPTRKTSTEGFLFSMSEPSSPVVKWNFMQSIRFVVGRKKENKRRRRRRKIGNVA